MLSKGLLEERLKSCKIFNSKFNSAKIIIPKKLENIFLINFIFWRFYEGLNQALFSGEQNLFFKDVNSYPDLTDYRRGRYIEVKCAGHSRRIMLKDSQINNYRLLQMSNEPIKNPRIYFTIYRYGFKGILKKFKNKKPKEIVESLAENTKFMVGIPFSVISHAHSYGEKYEVPLLSRKFGVHGIPSTHLSTVLIDDFFEKPEKALEYLELNPTEFKIRYYKTSDGIKVNGFEVKPFSIVLIKSSDEFEKRFVDGLK